MKRVRFGLICTALLLPKLAGAQTTVEVTSGTSQVSSGYGDHSSTGIRIRHQRARDVWYVGASYETRFNEHGWLGNVANTHTIDRNWTSHLSATAGTDVFFLPRYRFDGQLARALGGPRSWIATVSAMTSAAHDEHRDVGAGVGLLRFLPGGFAAEAGVFWKRTHPEDLTTRRQSAGLTWYGEQRELSVRGSFGKESYLHITPDSVLVDFDSHDVTARWVEWVGAGVGIVVSVTYYQNPEYHSKSYSATVIKRLGR